MNKSLLTYLGEAVDAYRVQRREPQPESTGGKQRTPGWRGWLPSKGNVLFTLLLVGLLVVAQTVGALPSARQQGIAPDAPSTGTIAYQGRLADADGNPLTDTVPMIFRLYDAANGGAPLWEEQWTGSSSVLVSDGLFNVMLGSLTPIPASLITSNASLFLGITVGTDDEMAPRVQLGSVPFAVQALTVPDGSVTTGKLADGAVTQAKLGPDVSVTPPDGSVTTAKLSDGAVTPAKLSLNSLNVQGSGANMAYLKIGKTYGAPSAHGDWVGIDFQHVNEVSPTPQFTGNPAARISAVLERGDNGYGLGLWTRNRHDTFTEKVRITADGRVGVGTTNPGATLDVIGDLHATGTKSAVVQTDEYGKRTLYAVEAPEVRLSDEGLARLQDGAARISLDPIFLETIEGKYLVHVTPYGNAALYVAAIGKDHFIVKAHNGDPNAAFAWRLSATRKGYAGVRLEEVN